MIYTSFAADMLPGTSAVAEMSVVWLAGVLFATQLGVLGIASIGMMRSWRRRAVIE